MVDLRAAVSTRGGPFASGGADDGSTDRRKYPPGMEVPIRNGNTFPEWQLRVEMATQTIHLHCLPTLFLGS